MRVFHGRRRRTKHNRCLSWVLRLEGSSNKCSLDIHPSKHITFGLSYLMFQWVWPQLHLKALEDARLCSKFLKFNLIQLLPKKISCMCANPSFFFFFQIVVIHISFSAFPIRRGPMESFAGTAVAKYRTLVPVNALRVGHIIFIICK